MLSRAVAVLVTICPFFSSAQFSRPDEKFPAGEKFLYPVNPGAPGELAGTMGELRPTHFHSGIDIRCNNMEGIPVLASKSGYVSRVTVSPTGYGNVMYISHPDGYTTLYAHLLLFSGAVGDFVLKEQYKLKSANVDLHFKEGQFPVTQGDTVALTGNTGSSAGAHLHFDIRDPENYALNPLKVELFTEIVDNLPPAVEKIALKTLDINSRINDKFGRFEFHVQRVGNDFIFPVPILATGNIGVEILAKDKLAPKSKFFGGVNYIEMRLDSQLIFDQSIEKINIAQTRSINTLINYRVSQDQGTRFYKLYIDDGNDLDFYQKSPGPGKINISKPGKHPVEVTVKDSHGNKSNVSFTLLSSALVREVKLLEPMKVPAEYDIQENVLKVSFQPCLTDSNRAVIFSAAGQKVVEPNYHNAFRAVYLIDLRKDIPDSIVLCGTSVTPHIRVAVSPERSYTYYSDLVDVQFANKSLYDTLFLKIDHNISVDSVESIIIGNSSIPLDKAIDITYRPQLPVKWDTTMAVYRISGKNKTYIPGTFENGAVRFTTREFGEFRILKDTVPPTIIMKSVNNTAVSFRVRDDLSGIDENFEATIDGQWILMHYDKKSTIIWSEKLDKTKPFQGEFRLVVKDNAGNKTYYNHKLF